MSLRCPPAEGSRVSASLPSGPGGNRQLCLRRQRRVIAWPGFCTWMPSSSGERLSVAKSPLSRTPWIASSMSSAEEVDSSPIPPELPPVSGGDIPLSAHSDARMPSATRRDWRARVGESASSTHTDTKPPYCALSEGSSASTTPVAELLTWAAPVADFIIRGISSAC